MKGTFDNTSSIEVRDTLIRKGVGNTLAFRTGKMLESTQTEVPTRTNSIAIKTTQGCPHRAGHYHLIRNMIVDTLLGEPKNTGI